MTYTDEANPFTQRKFITAAVIVAVIAVMGVILALTLGNTDPDESNPAASPSTSPAPSASSSSSTTPDPATSTGDAAASVCGLPAGDQATPTVPPAATWQLVGTMAMPTAEDIGPGTTSPEGIHSCYAHNPTGALFAAVGAMADGDSGVDQAALLEARTVPSPTRDAAITEAQQVQKSQTTPTDEMPDGYGGERRVQVAGYQITATTPATVSLMIVLSTPGQTSYSGVPVTMQWYEGDWRMVYQDSVTPVGLSSLAGYVPWGGA
jgi:hypothetical protein